MFSRFSYPVFEIIDSPFSGLENELSSPISPCLSLEDHFYIEDLVAKAEAESLEKLC